MVNVAVVIAGVLLDSREDDVNGGLDCSDDVSWTSDGTGRSSGRQCCSSKARRIRSLLRKIMATPTERSDETICPSSRKSKADRIQNVHFKLSGRKEEALRGVSFKILPVKKL